MIEMSGYFFLQVSDQRVRTLESNMEAERAAHLESKFNQELMQVENTL